LSHASAIWLRALLCTQMKSTFDFIACRSYGSEAARQSDVFVTMLGRVTGSSRGLLMALMAQHVLSSCLAAAKRRSPRFLNWKMNSA
jgi:hypothetical protein